MNERPRRLRRKLLALLVVLGALPLDAVPIERIIDPRPGSATVDLTRTLTPAEVGVIDDLARRARAGGELVVVIVPSLDGALPRAYATRLFNRWRLDTRERSRGVLLLVALSDRKAEIVVGDGYPTAATQVTDRIMRDVIVARFKTGRAREAIVEGARALTSQLIVAAERTRPDPGPAGSGGARASAPTGGQIHAEYEPGLLMRLSFAALEHPRLTFGGFVCALAAAYVAPKLWRRRPRKCPDCGHRMLKLDEKADDTCLTSAEQAEERAGSVDYDVWSCPACRRAEKLRYARRFSHRSCSRCGARTLDVTTTDLGGDWIEVRESCSHCSYAATHTRKDPGTSNAYSNDAGSSGGGSSSGSGSSGSW